MRKSFLPVLFGLFLAALALQACVAEKGESTPDIRELTIFYSADTHGHIVSGPETIGLDQVAGIKKATPNSLLLDAGDFCTARFRPTSTTVFR